MRTNIKTVIVSLVIATLIAGNAFAGTGCGFTGRRDKSAEGKDAVMRELNLSADQQKSLDEQRTAHRKAMETLSGALKEKKRELQDALARPDATKEQVATVLDQVKKLQSDIAEKRVDGIFAVKGILSPEQFAKLQVMRDKRMQDGHKRHGRKEQR